MYKYLIQLLVIETGEIEFVASHAYSHQAAILKVQETYTEDKFTVAHVFKEIQL